jgi:hypothetical protein
MTNTDFGSGPIIDLDRSEYDVISDRIIPNKAPKHSAKISFDKQGFLSAARKYSVAILASGFTAGGGVAYGLHWWNQETWLENKTVAAYNTAREAAIDNFILDSCPRFHRVKEPYNIRNSKNVPVESGEIRFEIRSNPDGTVSVTGTNREGVDPLPWTGPVKGCPTKHASVYRPIRGSGQNPYGVTLQNNNG